MNVRLERDVDPAAWALLLDGDPSASYYHTLPFIDSLCSVYRRFEARYLVARSDSSGLAGGLPIVLVRQAGLTQVLSLPFGSYGQPVVVPGPAGDAARRALLEGWCAEARRSGVVRAHLIGAPGRAARPVDALPAAWKTPERTHLIDLTAGFDDIWHNRYDKENRTASRKAERAGVTVAREDGAEGADVLDRLYRTQSVEWTDHAPYEYGLFRKLVAADPERVRIWVARKDGAPVFATMTFRFGGTATPWVSGSTKEARALCAGNLIHKVMIEDAVKQGCSVYNFGGSGGVAGIEAFKVAFGAGPVDYASWFSEAAWFRRFRDARRRLLSSFRGAP